MVNPDAGSVNADLVTRLRKALPAWRYLEYDKKLRLADVLAAPGRVVVAGGDGAVGRVARQLLHSRNSLGIIPVGTANNFAHSLGIPTDIGAAIDFMKSGRPRPVSIGTVNGKPFLEAAMVGLFGEILKIGQAVEDRDLGDLMKWVDAAIDSPRFEYTLSGSLQGHGVARSLIFANTPRIGTRVQVAYGTPRDAYLELRAGDAAFQFNRVRLRTKPRVRVFADTRPAGQTPASIEVDVGALRVVLGPPRR